MKNYTSLLATVLVLGIAFFAQSCSSCKNASTYTGTTHNSMKYGHDGQSSPWDLNKSKTPYAQHKAKKPKKSHNYYASRW